MNGEISLMGVYMPTILLLAVIASVLTLAVMRLADFIGFYRIVAYRALVDLCLYVMILGALSLLAPYLGFHSMKNLLPAIGRSAATIAIVVLAVVIAMWMWTHYERSPWTRDGRVRADVVRVTPDIGGLVTSVAVHDNQMVKAGDPLFVIDRPRYSLAVEQAQASVASARATLGQAQREASRDLALGDLVATESHEQNVARVATAKAALAEAVSALDGAKLNLARTQVKASVNGTVTNLDLHPGDYVAAGRQAMALVDDDSIRVEGYFEETKLPLIRVGAEVSVHLMGEAKLLKGRVESIAAGINDDSRSDSGNLLPNVEATFTWVRLAQRIPVRVRLTHVPKDVRLIVGRTATVTIEPHRRPAHGGRQ